MATFSDFLKNFQEIFRKSLFISEKVVNLYPKPNKGKNFMEVLALTKTLRTMQPGESQVFPMEHFKHTTIRNRACEMGKERSLYFSTHIDRIGRRYIVSCYDLKSVAV